MLKNGLKKLKSIIFIYIRNSPNLAKILVATKYDLPDKEVATDFADILAKEIGVEFVETSAKTGYNVDLLFHKIATKILNNLPKEYSKNNQGNIKIVKPKPKEKKEKKNDCC